MNKSSLNYLFFLLPVLILSIVFVLQLFSYTFFPPSYRYDETILTTISRQPLRTSIESVTAELHPPGFYLLLRLFPTLDISATRISLALLIFSLYFSLLVFLYKSSLVKKYQLYAGLSILFASCGFFEITSTIKQEMISLPLLMWSFFLALYTLHETKRTWLFFVVLNFLSLLILSFGYIYYVISLISLAGIFFNHYTNKKYIATVGAHLCIVTMYIVAYGFQQIGNNTSRFSWHDDNYNSFFRALSTFLIGGVFSNVLVDLCVLIFIIGIVFFAYHFKKISSKSKIFVKALVGCTILFVIGYYITNLYVRSRYVFPLFFLLCLLSGWGLTQATYAKKLISAFCFLLLFLNIIVITQPYENDQLKMLIQNYTSQKDQDARIGFIDEHPLYPYIFRINNPEATMIIPLNIFQDTTITNYSDLTKEQIMYDGIFLDATTEEYANMIQKTDLHHFIYRMRSQDKISYYDPERKILNTLSKNCDLAQITTLNYRNTFFEFYNCKFE